MRKGFVYMLEAILAGMLLVGGLMVFTVPTISQLPEKDFQAQAIRLLSGLDDQGRLRNLTIAKNVSAIANEFVFPSHNLTVEVCDHKDACTGQRPLSKNVFTGLYLIAGESVFEPFAVRLYLGDEP